jgi:enamine deaminase RidA (YjgF/YER057c/UK114 family)
MDIYQKLKDLQIELPAAPPPAGLYAPARFFAQGKMVYLSGCLPVRDDKLLTGRLGRELTLEQGQMMARSAMLSALAVLHREISDLNRIRSIVKITTFIASDDSFFEQPQVANGGSQLLADIFGKHNVPARSAVGVNVLPLNMPVETELLVELF